MIPAKDDQLQREVAALRKVNEAVSDYLLGKQIPQFARMNGGVRGLLQSVRIAHNDYEAEFNTLPD